MPGKSLRVTSLATVSLRVRVRSHSQELMHLLEGGRHFSSEKHHTESSKLNILVLCITGFSISANSDISYNGNSKTEKQSPVPLLRK